MKATDAAGPGHATRFPTADTTLGKEERSSHVLFMRNEHSAHRFWHGLTPRVVVVGWGQRCITTAQD
jgi:hypothetical protein